MNSKFWTFLQTELILSLYLPPIYSLEFDRSLESPKTITYSALTGCKNKT